MHAEPAVVIHNTVTRRGHPFRAAYGAPTVIPVSSRQAPCHVISIDSLVVLVLRSPSIQAIVKTTSQFLRPQLGGACVYMGS